MDETALDQFDWTLGMDFSTEPAAIRELTAQLEQAEAFDVDDASTSDLAQYAYELKELADAAESARKEVFEAELHDRVEVNERVGPLTRRQGSRRFVKDDTEAFDAINLNGGNPLPAISMKATKTEEILRECGLDPAQFIGVTEYEYFRR